METKVLKAEWRGAETYLAISFGNTYNFVLLDCKEVFWMREAKKKNILPAIPDCMILNVL